MSEALNNILSYIGLHTQLTNDKDSKCFIIRKPPNLFLSKRERTLVNPGTFTELSFKGKYL